MPELKTFRGCALLHPVMAQEHIQDGIRIFSLVSADGGTRADVVPELGATVSSLLVPGLDGAPRECLYRHPWFWEGHPHELRGGIPPLFPVCARLLKDGTRGLYHVDGQPFVLPIHGFALRLPWEVVDAEAPDSIRLRLVDSASTRAAYPFSFELDLRYAVAHARLDCRLAVRNTGAAPMPYYAGLHPYFATPPPGAGKEQTLYDVRPRRRHRYNDALTDIVGTGPAPAFPVPVTNGGINETLLEVEPPGESRLLHPDGFEIRQTADPIFRFRQLYTLPDRPFFCDEPWMAPPGSMNRPGAARLLPPGQAESGAVRIEAGP